MEDRKFKCCICGNVYKGFGNNPWPIDKDETAVCCNACNEIYILPARMAQMFGGKKYE